MAAAVRGSHSRSLDAGLLPAVIAQMRDNFGSLLIAVRLGVYRCFILDYC